MCVQDCSHHFLKKLYYKRNDRREVILHILPCWHIKYAITQFVCFCPHTALCSCCRCVCVFNGAFHRQNVTYWQMQLCQFSFCFIEIMKGGVGWGLILLLKLDFHINIEHGKSHQWCVVLSFLTCYSKVNEYSIQWVVKTSSNV